MTECSVGEEQNCENCTLAFCLLKNHPRLQRLPSNSVAKVIVNEIDRPESSDDPIVGSMNDKQEEGIDKHDEDAGYLDHSPRMSDEGLQSHPS
jgi:hypothetical protein